MAFSFNDYTSSGLNLISSLDHPLVSNSKNLPPPLQVPTPLGLHHSRATNATMSDKNKSTGGGGFGSRIPKINFGFRKQTKTAVTNSNDNGNCSERSTPEGCEGSPPPARASGTKSASSSNNSSPIVGRSKSLRLPRSTYTKYSVKVPQSNIDTVRDEAEDFYPDDSVDSGSSGDGSGSGESRQPRTKTGQTSLVKSGRPRSSTMSASHSRSRSISPGGLMMTTTSSTLNGTSKFGFYGGSLSQSDPTNEDEDLDIPPATNLSRRSQSFSAKHQTRIRTGSFGAHNRLQPPQAGSNQPFRRSKTPTPLSQRSSQTGQTGSRNGSSKLAVSRTSSLGKVKQQSVATTNSRGNVNVSNQLNAQSRFQASSGISRSSSGDLRGKRPSSVVLADGAADLNTIAQELSQGDASQPEIKSVTGRTRPSSAKNLSLSTANSKRSHSSIGYSKTSYQGSETPEQRRSPPATASPSSSKSKYLSARGRSGSIEKQNRPTSAQNYYRHGRNNSLGGNELQSTMVVDTNLETHLERSHSAANFESSDDVTANTPVRPQRKSSGRGSAPSSGRSTPVHRSMSATKLGKDAIDGGVVSSVSKPGAGLPPRTPYSRGVRTKTTPTSSSAGINELEGSVMLEADDYRRISNDVKSLKTALLKLKRELHSDLEGKTPSSQPAQTPRTVASTPVRVGRSVTTPGTAAGLDLRKKLKTITNERDKALEEVGSCKKELKVKSSKIESLMAELEKEKKKNEELASELEQVEAHRSHLLDKVERLHADKHNLEARLNTLERASVYEQTFSESWLDEVDGDCEDFDIMDPALGADGGTKRKTAVERKEMTESEIGDLIQSDGGEGESSEPESAAVCSAPIS